MRDAEYIRAAAAFGYPSGAEGDGWDGEDGSLSPLGLHEEKYREAAYGETYNQL